MGQIDDACMKLGKEISDTLQEALDKDNRVADTLNEGFQVMGALDGLQNVRKASAEAGTPVPTRKMVAQVLRGALNDVLAEDFSCDGQYEPGSQL